MRALKRMAAAFAVAAVRAIAPERAGRQLPRHAAGARELLNEVAVELKNLLRRYPAAGLGLDADPGGGGDPVTMNIIEERRNEASLRIGKVGCRFRLTLPPSDAAVTDLGVIPCAP
jgi:hypothetical protein